MTRRIALAALAIEAISLLLIAPTAWFLRWELQHMPSHDAAFAWGAHVGRVVRSVIGG